MCWAWVWLLICSSSGGEIGGRSLGEIDGKMEWNGICWVDQSKMESALLGIKETSEWESLDNVFNFLPGGWRQQSALWNAFVAYAPACKINLLLFRIDRFRYGLIWARRDPFRPMCFSHLPTAAYTRIAGVIFQGGEFDWQTYICLILNDSNVDVGFWGEGFLTFSDVVDFTFTKCCRVSTWLIFLSTVLEESLSSSSACTVMQLNFVRPGIWN